jgi:hypothetical protein
VWRSDVIRLHKAGFKISMGAVFSHSGELVALENSAYSRLFSISLDVVDLKRFRKY